jgi:pimeloyl-ACP methyl ester carboxylesterase
VARETRVCVYDRAGRGWSEPADTIQDGAQIAADLHTLLHRAHVPGPYVLAGHSFGGLYVLAFAARYPDDVAGMVLVDSTAPASAPQATTTANESSYDGLGHVAALVSISARLGLARVYGQLTDDGLPPRSSDEVRAFGATAGNLRSTIDEYVHAAASMQEAASLRDFGDRPLVVLTAGTGNDAAWPAAQNHLATLSTNSVHRIVDAATHEALVGDPDHAVTTTQAVLQVVTAMRSAKPLTH